MTQEERNVLFADSVPADPEDPRSNRYAVRRVDGRLELFEAQGIRAPDGAYEFHGYPWVHEEFWPNPHPVPHAVLVALRNRGDITRAEYKKALKNTLFS